MADGVLSKLEAVDPSVLISVVRQDQNSPSFDVTGWSVRRLSDQGIMNPDGLWLYEGEGKDETGSRPWSVAVKIFNRPEKETPQANIRYWQRELLVARSRLTERLPGPVRAPRFYRADETPEGGWLWMEFLVDESPNAWTVEQFTFAAEKLGEWNGRCMLGAPLPDYPWLAKEHYRDWLGDDDPKHSWGNPYNQKYMSAGQRERCERLWTEREIFFNALEALPRTFSHFDSQRRNLFIRSAETGREELAIVDWAMCGWGPVGAELYALVGMSFLLNSAEMAQIHAIGQAAFDGYVRGLRVSGWEGDTALVRLGYTAFSSVYLGISLPTALAWWTSEDARPFALQQYGVAGEELYLKIFPFFDYFLDCGDEARSLINRLGFG